MSARFASSDRQSGSLVRVPTSFGEVRLIRQAVWLVGASANEFRRGSPHQTGSLARWCECQRVSARFASSDRQSGSLVRVPTSVGLVLASESISGSAETFIARWCEFQRVSAWRWPQKVFLAPQRLLLRGACARMCVRMGWSELSRRAPMGHACAVVAACMCAWGGASALVVMQRTRSEAMSDAVL